MQTLFFDHFDNNRICFYYLLNFGCYNSTELAAKLEGRRYAFSRMLQKLFPQEHLYKGQDLSLNWEKPALKNYAVKLYRQKGEKAKDEAPNKDSVPMDFSLYLKLFKLIAQKEYLQLAQLPQLLEITADKNTPASTNEKPRAAYFRLRTACQELTKLGYITPLDPASPSYLDGLAYCLADQTNPNLEKYNALEKAKALKEAKEQVEDDYTYNKTRPLIYKTERDIFGQLDLSQLKKLYVALYLVNDMLPLNSLLYGIMEKLQLHYKKFMGSTIEENWLARVRVNNAYQGQVLSDETLLNLLLAAEKQQLLELEYFSHNDLKNSEVYKAIPQGFILSTSYSQEKVKVLLEAGTEKELFLDCTYLAQDPDVPLYHEIFSESFQDQLSQADRTVPILLTYYEKAYLKYLLQLKVFTTILDGKATKDKALSRLLGKQLETIYPLPLQLLKYLRRSTPFTILNSKENSIVIPLILEALRTNKQLNYVDSSTSKEIFINPFELVFRPFTCSYVLTGLIHRGGFVTLKLSQLNHLQLTAYDSTLNDNKLYHTPLDYLEQSPVPQEPLDYSEQGPIPQAPQPNFRHLHLLLETPLLNAKQAYKLFYLLRTFRKNVWLLSRPKRKKSVVPQKKPPLEQQLESFQILLFLNELYGESRPEKLMIELLKEGLINYIAPYRSEKLSKTLEKINK